MQCLTKKKHIIPLTHDSQTGAFSHTINMPGATHKGIIRPTLGQWLVSLLCLHLLMEGLLNHRVSKEIILEEQGLNRKGPSLTLFQ